MSAAQIRQRIESILTYMKPYWEFVNCHMVNYLTDQHWEHYIPAALRSEVQDIKQAQRCIETVFWRRKAAGNEDDSRLETEFPEFEQFLKQAEQHCLSSFTELVTTLPMLHSIFGKVDATQQLPIKEFMSEKKRHEVEITAALVHDLIESYKRSNHVEEMFVIDAGDGKGYLSSRLALEYEHKVLGIDANESNTTNALERSKKLQRAWNGLTERAALTKQGIQPPRRGKKPSNKNRATANVEQLNNYKTTAKYITKDINFAELLMEHFPSSTYPTELPNICLTGLHTCGNLAPTCLEVFHAQPTCKVLCSIGCCYHLLKEAYSGPEFFGNKAIMELQTHPGFPLSSYLQQKQCRLGRNARMLAAQSIERTLAAKELPNISLYYRALLEVWLCGKDATLRDTIQVGKVRKFANFPEYVQQCDNHNKLPFALDDDARLELQALEGSYELQRHYLDLYYLLRMSFAPVLETIILLDRLMSLKEQGYVRSYLVPVFDAVISPRHYAIIAIKDDE